ncbi:hypothetical protein BJY01DRAFT_240495 [Aspergillus pseudoustus]|uniref:Protein kinase domain-containing protein n=1 Tax=Aspergillus pseudoustus TaxID=1810923 RepID=A0ABR4IQR5_9EURO
MTPLRRKCGVGHGTASVVHKPLPTGSGQPFSSEIEFYKLLNSREDRCPGIIECFLALPDYLFLIDSALIARWVHQISRALEYMEKMGFCHNDLAPRDCPLDSNLNMRLCDFDRATTVGQYLESIFAPWGQELTAGPLKGTYGLCGARTEQFALGTLVYCMLISACWHNVYPAMALVAYDFKRKTIDFALEARREVIDFAKEKKNCKKAVWRRYLHFLAGKVMYLWQSLSDSLRRRWSTLHSVRPKEE